MSPASKGSFRRNVLTLMSGTAIAQSIAILVSPILTRLYSPSEFGELALYLAVTQVAIAIAAGKYEMAIVLPEIDADAFNLTVLSALITVAASVACLLLIVVCGASLSHLLGHGLMPVWLYTIPFFVLLGGLSNVARYWFNRTRNYRRIARNGILRAGLAAGANVTFGLMGKGSVGLIGGAILAQTVATGLFCWQIWHEQRELLSFVSLRAMGRQARKQLNFPKYLVASGLVESLSSQLPSILFGSFFGSSVLGHMSLGTRVVNTPLSVISSSIGDVFRQAASRVYALTGNCREIFMSTLKRLVLLSIGPALLMWTAPWVFTVMFGPKWAIAGGYVRIMTLMFLLRFVASPLSTVLYIAQKQRWDFLLQLTLFASISGALFGVYALGGGPEVALVLFSSIYCVKYLVELLASYNFTASNQRQITIIAET